MLQATLNSFFSAACADGRPNDRIRVNNSSEATSRLEKPRMMHLVQCSTLRCGGVRDTADGSPRSGSPNPRVGSPGLLSRRVSSAGWIASLGPASEHSSDRNPRGTFTWGISNPRAAVTGVYCLLAGARKKPCCAPLFHRLAEEVEPAA